MVVKTKKYQLDKKTYIKLALENVFRQQWWAFLIPIAVAALTFIYPDTIWFWLSALIATVLYILFWLIQFSGATQLDQFKILFDRYKYHIDSKNITIWLDTKRGMPIPWDKIKRAFIKDKGFVLVMSKAQITYLPFRIFNNRNEIKFVESLLIKKGLVKKQKVKV